MYTTAYTAVPARKQLYAQQPPPPPPPHMIPPPPMLSQPVHHPPPRTQFPEPVRQYVQRAFAESNNIESITRTDIEVKLKHVISHAAEHGQLTAIDWNSLLLPQQMIKLERDAAYATFPMSNSSMNNSYSQDTNVQTFEPTKKRKSSDLSTGNGRSSLPPWRTKTDQSKSLDSRITTPNKRQKSGNEVSAKKAQAELDKQRRMQRFQNNGKPVAKRELDPEQITLGPVVGRCQDLEKRYLRLTSAPNPDFVRPLEVLRKTLELLKSKWSQDGNYIYINDQFKSMRQDLTVQHIKNDFTVIVYENHARIALEQGDLGEYNQCQTQLRTLYAERLGGHPVEFKAYRILYFLYTANRMEMSDTLMDLTAADKKEPAIKHALDTRSALALGNYHRFFKLYLDTPNMGAYLLDKFVDRERLAALASICKAYKPDISLRFVTKELAFDSDAEAAKFICERGGEDFLEERDGGVRFLTGKVGKHFDSLSREAIKMVDNKG